jgi:hypothetical protein
MELNNLMKYIKNDWGFMTPSHLLSIEDKRLILGIDFYR